MMQQINAIAISTLSYLLLANVLLVFLQSTKTGLMGLTTDTLG